MRLTSLVLLMFLVACGAAPVAQAPTSVPTALPTDTTIPSRTLEPEPTDVPATPTVPATQTREPTATSAPTSTPEPTVEPTPDTNAVFALNNLAVKEIGGIRLEIARVVVGRKDALADLGFGDVEKFNDVETVVEILFRLTNLSDSKRNVHPNQGTVVIGNEQIDLTEWMFAAQIGDIGGEVFPGVTQVGGLWFGVKRSSVTDINKMIVSVGAPSNDSFQSQGEDFYFEIDLSNHEYQEMPNDLK